MALSDAQLEEMYRLTIGMAPQVDRLLHRIEGNGQPGLVHEVTIQGERLAELTAKVQVCQAGRDARDASVKELQSVVTVAKSGLPILWRVAVWGVVALSAGGGGYAGVKAILKSIVAEAVKSGG